MTPARTSLHAWRQQRGLSLVELMVGLVIALVVSLVMYNVFIFAENQRRTTGAGSDAQQAGSFSSFALERILRMGGAGVTQIPSIVGCELSVATATGATRVPLPDTLPAPFDTLGLSTLRVTPALIVNGSSSDDDEATSTAPDALVTVAGTHPNVNTWLQMTSPGTATAAPVLNSVGLRPNDLLLAVEQDTAAPNAGLCTLVQSVSEIETDAALANVGQSERNNGRTIDLGGTYTPTSGLAPGTQPYSAVSLLANLGTQPLMRIFALGPEATEAGASQLLSFDMLTGGTPESLADGVVNLQAVYGLAASADSDAVTRWAHPVGDFSAATLMDGSAASAANLALIRAVRVAVVTRSSLLEREGDVSASPEWAVFTDDEALAVSGTRTGEAARYRYRQYDFIVPLRNALLRN